MSFNEELSVHIKNVATMMLECDPTGADSHLSVLDTGGATTVPNLEFNFHSTDSSAVLFENKNTGLVLEAKPGFAVHISDSRESVLTELETDGSSEEALLLPCLAGSSSSPRGAREKRNRHSSSSEKDTLASPGICFTIRADD